MFKKNTWVRNRKKKGQSTIEYILLVAAVIGVLLAFLNPSSGKFRELLNKTLYTGTNGMVDMAQRLRDSRPAVSK